VYELTERLPYHDKFRGQRSRSWVSTCLCLHVSLTGAYKQTK